MPSAVDTPGHRARAGAAAGAAWRRRHPCADLRPRGVRPCPDFTTGAILSAGLTSAAGSARYNLAIPSSSAFSGFDLFGQFVLLGSNCLSAFDLTSALQVTIE